MREEECRRLASRVRAFILDLRAEGFTYEWSDDLDSACAVASYTLCEYLKRNNGDAVLVEGEFQGMAHCWVETMCDGETFIVDITATQFGKRYRDVEIVSLDNEDYVPLNKGDEALESISEWPTEQDPHTYMSHIDAFLGGVE